MLARLPLNATDLSVSQICLGTNMFGSALPEEAASGILDLFFGSGGNFIDTARSYGDWVPGIPRAASEHALGRLLTGRARNSYVIATKGCEFDYRGEHQGFRVAPAFLDSDLKASLDALHLDFIDLYWLHRDDPTQPVGAIIDALIHHQQDGRIRYFGCSNWSPARIQEAQTYARDHGHPGFAACQPMWGLADPDREAMNSFCPGGYYEDGYRPLHEAGLTMIPYSGQSRGFFSKLADNPAKESFGPDLAALFHHPRNLARLPVIQSIAQAHGASINQIVLAYLTSQPLATIPIIGASKPAQLKESIAACALKLSAGELQRLHDA
ncbi:MAG: aldo/keto reductase [Proteobacteria bacterium]|nr:aldo/keto reductase [Pseudomonadota bacterium]HQR03466.1 aldo/keto reductase [Rhodocyclaceae bacterium]